MEEKEIKVIEICFFGNYSIGGSILSEYGANITKRINEYKWIFLINKESFDNAKEECLQIGIEDFIITERRGMIVEGNWKNKTK